MALHVHVLDFENDQALQRAFASLSEHSDVESCLVESGGLRIRFLAAARAGKAIVERLYDEGGLKWCSRHLLNE
ncbi:MAG: hypothetical protein AAF547_05830 [Actinomycetota bacterium]